MTIGEGSFSSVYRVRQTALDRWVAIKILSEKNPLRREELLKEAKIQAQMPLGCIPDIYDAFIWGQQVCIVMEWIKGVSLFSILEKDLPQWDPSVLASAIISALASLHRLGFAHRDLKPANILISPKDGIYLVDLGFAKKMDGGKRSIVDAVKGTPAYMAPELWEDRDAINFMKADLFALGRILRQLDLGSEWEIPITALLADNPLRRPESAFQFWTEWETKLAPRHSSDWKILIGQFTAQELSVHLMQATKNLLFAKREEEAYWLLSECLEENPDSLEALKMMEQFPSISQRKNRIKKIWSVGILLGFMSALALAFYFGKQSAKVRTFAVTSANKESRVLLVLPHKSNEHLTKGLRLKEMVHGQNQLSGWVYIENPESCDRLFIDQRLLIPATARVGIPVVFGTHILFCRDKMGHDLQIEKMSLLPFQRKTFSMLAQRSSKDLN